MSACFYCYSVAVIVTETTGKLFLLQPPSNSHLHQSHISSLLFYIYHLRNPSLSNYINKPIIIIIHKEIKDNSF